MAEEHREQGGRVDTAEEEVAARIARERLDRDRIDAGEARDEGAAESEEERAARPPTEEEGQDEEALAERRPDGAADGELARRDGVEPDVLLHVPEVKVDEISVEVDELDARVALHAEVANLVKLDVGADVHVGRVKIEIKGVEAAALLKVRLDEVYKILERTLTTIDSNPQLLESLLKPVGEAVGEVGKGAGKAVPELGKGVGEGVGEVGKGVGQAAPELGKGVGEAGKGVGEAGGEAAKGVGEAGGEAAKGAGEAGGEAAKGVGEAGAEATQGVGESAQRATQPAGEAMGRTVEAGAGAAERVGGEVRERAEPAMPPGAGNPVGERQDATNETRRERGDSMGEKEAPVSFDKLKDDLVKVAQDVGDLVKEGLGEPGGKGLLGQISRLTDAFQEWKQEQDGKKEKAEGQAKEGEEKAEAKPEEGEEEVTHLFDGSEESFGEWKLVGSGSLDCEDGQIRLEAGDDLGLLYFEQGKLDHGILRLRFCPESPEFEAGVAVRFRNPGQAVPDREDPETKYNYDNPAYVAPHTGFTVLLASNRPGAEPGTFEGVLLGDAPGAQLHPERGEVCTGEWNELEVEFEGNCFSARLNGKATASFANVDAYRGKSSQDDPDAGFVGILPRRGRLRLEAIDFQPREAPSEAAQPSPEAAGQEAPQ